MPNYRSPQVTNDLDLNAQGSTVTSTLVGEQLQQGGPVTVRTDVSVKQGDLDDSYKARDVLNPGELIQLEAIMLKIRLHQFTQHGYTEI